MNVTQLAEQLRTSEHHRKNFTAWQHLPARPARHAPFPAGMDERLVEVLRRRGIEQLWTHQAEAVEAVGRGENVVVVTPAASGKTLCYNLPVLNTLLSEPEARALYLFPTKALSQDQVDELHGLITELDVDIKTFTYDGDTPASARRAIRAAGQVVVTNPDMLHTGILPHHTRWLKLFENLRYVVIDELHAYRGVFGSHVANVLRRLKRICRFYGSSPLFICCSATIANPVELAGKLTGGRVRLIERSGAPSGEKIVALYNPPLVNRELGIRRSSVLTARGLATDFLANDIPTIVFGRSRLVVELLTTYLKDEMARRRRSPEKVRGYRAGYLPSERRSIERGLRDGEVTGVVATSALELGVDIGSLDACVLVGYPGTLASTWQQIGRAGRRAGLSVAVLVAGSSPLDQYVATHPEYLFSEPPESGLVNPNNLLILASHLKCAAFELPFEEGEDFGVGTTAEILAYLEEQGLLYCVGGKWHWAAESYPAEEISLRSASPDNVVIIENTPEANVVGEVDRVSAPMLVHEEAIYIHEGQQYQVERLDYEERKAYVKKVDVDYYTDAQLAVDLRVLEVWQEQPLGRGQRAHGEVAVSYRPTMFKKLKLDTHENVGNGQIHLPQEDMHTTAYWLSLDEEAQRGFVDEGLQGALLGVANLLVNVSPLYLMCEPRDLREVCQVRSPFTGRPTVFIYDDHPGGVGLSEKLYSLEETALLAAHELVSRCPCEDGCPSCVGPRLEVGSGGKNGAKVLLERLLERGR